MNMKMQNITKDFDLDRDVDHQDFSISEDQIDREMISSFFEKGNQTSYIDKLFY